MKINKRLGKFLNNVITYWEESSVVTPDLADKLRNSYEIISFDWKRLAKYSFWIALICIVISVSAALTDITGIIKKLWDHPFVSCFLFVFISTIFFFLGLKRRKNKPEKVYSNEAIFFLGVLSVAMSITFLGKALDTGSGHFSLLILLATIIYGILGVLFPSKLVWIFALLSFGGWLGTETGYASGWGAYFLGMNYPLHFVLFGATLTGLSFFLFKRVLKLIDFFKSTYVLGLLYLFIALWILSIFGNYGSMDSWYHAKQIELFHWALIFGLVAIGTSDWLQ
ncbi:MAG: DUF2157 domain-containing protein [Nitrospirota bacterium]